MREKVQRTSTTVDMETSALFVLGCLIATTYGFIPRFIRRDQVAQTVQRPDEMGVENRGDNEQSAQLPDEMMKAMSCMEKVASCPPISTMMDSMFQANNGVDFVVNNQLTFSCSADTKANFEECADTARSSCSEHTNWIDGLAGIYNDLCAMEQDLLSHAACMNSVTVSEEMEKCMSNAYDIGSVCRMVVPCVQGALDSEPMCTLQFQTKLMAAITKFRDTQFGAC